MTASFLAEEPCKLAASLFASSAAQMSPPTDAAIAYKFVNSSEAKTVAYTVFLLAIFGTYHSIGGQRFSSILTLSVMFQCLAVVLLGLQSLSSNSARGISARALVLEALSLGLRLSSTVWLNGYLPSDKTGDFLFQAVDVCSLVIVLWLLHRVLVVQIDTYQASEDSFSIAPVVLVSLVLAIVFHGDLNSRPLFDTLWMVSLFIGVAQVLPQLWLITCQDCVDALTGHYVAALTVSRLLSGAFMWYTRNQIRCSPWVDGINHASWAILGAHAFHLVLLADFGYYYVKALMKHGFAGRVELSVGRSHVV